MAFSKDDKMPYTTTIMETLVRVLTAIRAAKVITWERRNLVGVFDEDPDSLPAIYIQLIGEQENQESQTGSMNVASFAIHVFLHDVEIPERRLELMRKLIHDEINRDFTLGGVVCQTLFQSRGNQQVEDGFGIMQINYEVWWESQFTNY